MVVSRPTNYACTSIGTIQRKPLASPRTIWLEKCQSGSRGRMMDSKSRLILSLVMSSVMVLMVTLLVTFLNLGLRPDFLLQWAKAYAIAWPVAAATAFGIMPSA